MTENESRTVRDLLDANLRLTEQFIELARLTIGAPTAATVPVSTSVESPAQSPEFTLGVDDDWEDIPDKPLGNGAQVLEIARRRPPLEEVDSGLPLHMSEEEEDLRHAVAFGLKPSTELTDFIARLGLPGQELGVEFTPDA